MDHEFLEKVLACKTSEELRALLSSRRPLEDDELDQVNGGMILSGGKLPSLNDVDTVCKAAQRIESALGRDLAASWIAQEMGNRFTAEDYLRDGISGLRKHLDALLRRL